MLRVVLVRPVIVTVGVIYYRPDFRHILQEFYWQTNDLPPEFPRIHRFLEYWRKEICVPVADVSITWTDQAGEFRIEKP